MAAEEATTSDPGAGVDLDALEADIAGISLDALVESDSEDSSDGLEDEPLDLVLDLPLLCAKNVPADLLKDDDESPETLLAHVAKLDTIRLDRCGLTHLGLVGEVDGAISLDIPPTFTTPLSWTQNITSLYLQHNKLCSLRDTVNDTTTPLLRFLCLQNNQLNDDHEGTTGIQSEGTTRNRKQLGQPSPHPLRGLETLRNLKFLDCSKNEKLKNVVLLLLCLPDSLVFLNMQCTAVASIPDYRASLIASLDSLKQLDEITVTKKESKESLRSFGEDDFSDSEDEESFEDDDDNGEESTPVPTTFESTSSTTSSTAASAAARALDADTAGDLVVNEQELELDVARVKSKLEDVSSGVGISDAAGGTSVFRLESAANRAAERMESTRDQFVDMDARVRHEQKKHEEAMRALETGTEGVDDS